MVSKRRQAAEKKRMEQRAALDKVNADKIQRDRKASEKKKMADIAKKAEAAQVAEQAAAAAAAKAAAKLDEGAKGQDKTGNINTEVQRKEKEQKQASQRTAQGEEHKEKKKKSTLADKILSPRHAATKRNFSSPSSTSSMDTQDEEATLEIGGPPPITKKLLRGFESEIVGLSQEYTGFDEKGAYTSNNVKKDNATGRYIVADAKFVTELVEIDFGKEVTSRNKIVLFQKVNDHLKKCNETSDDPDNERFVQIVKNFKLSNLGNIFSKTGFLNKKDYPECDVVKQLFQCTLAIRRIEAGLPETVWFKEPWQMKHDQEEFLLSEHQAKQGVDSTKDILNKLTINGEEQTVSTGIDTLTATTNGAEGNVLAKEKVVTVTNGILPASGSPVTAGISTFFQNRTAITAAANKRLLGENLYTYLENYGQFGNKEPCKTGPYSGSAYTAGREYKSFDTPHPTDGHKRKNVLIDRVNEFDKTFWKYKLFSIQDKKATLTAITDFIIQLLTNPKSWDIVEVQSTVKILYRLANTSPEVFTAHWTYQSATLIQSPPTRVWLAANTALQLNWSILDQAQLGPKPVVKLPTANVRKTGILNTKNRNSPGSGGTGHTTNQDTPKPTRILRLASSTRRKTTLGNFRFLTEVKAKTDFTSTAHLTVKAPWPYETFVTMRTLILEEGGHPGEMFVMETVHTAFEYLWEVDLTMVLYPFPGKVQHSTHVSSYKKKHTRIPQTKKYRKISSTEELRRYTDKVFVCAQKGTWINFFIGHSVPIAELASCDVEYKFHNDQMRLLVKEVQSTDATTVAWLVGMCDKTTNCEELTAILRQSEYFQKIPVFVKVQPLKLRKTDPDTQWGSSKYTRVVTIQGDKRLRTVTLAALTKISIVPNRSTVGIDLTARRLRWCHGTGMLGAQPRLEISWK